MASVLITAFLLIFSYYKSDAQGKSKISISVTDTSYKRHIFEKIPNYHPDSTFKKTFFLIDKHFTYKKDCSALLTCNSGDLALVGINHPNFINQSSFIMLAGTQLIDKSPYLQSCISFSTGKELLKCLKNKCKNGKTIRNLVIMGHSDHYGFYVKRSAGLYANNFHIQEDGSKVIFATEAIKVKDLQLAFFKNEIRFHEDAVIILAGCRTAWGRTNIALEMAKALNVPVFGPNQKISFLGISNFGEEMVGEENKSFVAYIPYEGRIYQFDFMTNVMTISESIERVRKKKEEIYEALSGEVSYKPRIK